MTWHAIARKDVRDAGRSWTIWLVLALFVVLTVGTVVVAEFGGDGTVTGAIADLASRMGTIVPVVALLLGYKAIVDERLSGSIALSLSFPHSRRDLVLGKFIGRGVVLLGPILLALVLASVVGAFTFGTDVGVLLRYPWLLVLTGLYALVFLSLAIAFSMRWTSHRRVTLASFGVYLLLVVFWDDLVTATLLILHRFDTATLTEPPGWIFLARLLRPTEAYALLVDFGFDTGLVPRYASDAAPWYVGEWMALIILVAWIALPLGFAYHRFRGEDL